MDSHYCKATLPKFRGEWAEMLFMTTAAEHGLHVSRPYGEMSHFDFIIGNHGCLHRVQVKSTLAKRGCAYDCSVRGGHRPYADGVFDFVAALIIPERIWYIVPANLVIGRSTLRLHPESPGCRYAEFKESWHLLAHKPCAIRGNEVAGHVG